MGDGYVFPRYAPAWAAELILAWDPNNQEDVKGYKLYIGQTSKEYTTTIDVGKNTKYAISGLTEGKIYYFTLKTYGSSGQESGFSAEVMHSVPTTKNMNQPVNTDDAFDPDSSGGEFAQRLRTSYSSNPADPSSLPDLVEIPQTEWHLLYADSQETVQDDAGAVNAFDGDISTIWQTQWYPTDTPPPHEIQIDLGDEYHLGGFLYLPRQDGSTKGHIKRYEFYVSMDGKIWGRSVASGQFADEPTEKEVTFPIKSGRFIRLRCLNEVSGGPWTSAAELNVLGFVNR
jgi:hypothetical protein